MVLDIALMVKLVTVFYLLEGPGNNSLKSWLKSTSASLEEQPNQTVPKKEVVGSLNLLLN